MRFSASSGAAGPPVFGLIATCFNTRGHLPVALPFRVFSQCDLHEVGPDRQRGICAGQTELRSVVKPNPDDAHQVRRITCKPAVARSAGFAGDVCFEAARPDLRSRASIHYVFHERSHHVGNVGPQHLILLWSRRGDRHAGARRYAIDRNWAGACAESGESRCRPRLFAMALLHWFQAPSPDTRARVSAVPPLPRDS